MEHPPLKAGRSLPLTVADKLGLRFVAKRLRKLQRRKAVRSRVVQGLLDAGEHRLVWSNGQWLVSAEEAGVAPALVAQRNARLVRSALESVGVDSVVVSRSEMRNVQFAVRDEDWERAIDSLSGFLGERAFYLDLEALTVRKNKVARAYHVSDSEGIAVARTRSVLRAYQIVTDTTSQRSYGRNVSVELQRWHLRDGMRSSDSANQTAQFVAPGQFDERTEVTNRLGVHERRLTAAARPTPAEMTMPIDIVYMWVDGEDPAWRARFERERASRDGVEPAPQLEEIPVEDASPGELVLDEAVSEATAPWRFRDRDELLYSLRSLEMYAPWFRNVYLVTDDQAPVWLDLDNPRVKVVSHREIFADVDALPTFNSHAIGSQIHHIDGLSEHYLVLNDDVMFGAPTPPEAFFTGSGVVRFRPSRTHAPLAAPDELSEIENARHNAARMLENDFGARCSALFTHTPVPQVRSAGMELEERYAEAFDFTMRSRFRSRQDTETNAWLQLNYLLLTGRAVESSVRYGYYNVGSRSARRRLRQDLRRERAQVLCLNDGPSENGVDYDEWLTATLQTYFPRASSFELPVESWRDRTALDAPSASTV